MLSTDIIVGQPGETEKDHEETLRLVEDCAFDSAYVFKYSPRRGTEATETPWTVPDGVAQRQFVEVLRAVEGNALAGNRAKVGLEEEIFVRHGRNASGRVVGETWSGHVVHIHTAAVARRYVSARIESAGPHVLYAGEPVGPPC